MTIEDMRLQLGLGPDVPDEAVVQAWAEYIAGPVTGDPAVSLDEAKKHLRIEPDETGEDGLISALVLAAQEWVEGYTEVTLSARQVTQVEDGFAGWIDLNSWPVRSIVGISYLDVNGETQALGADQYIVSLQRRPSRIMAGLGGQWPVTARAAGAVSVTYEVGYPSAEEVPQALRQAILLLVGHWYRNREAVVITANAVDLPMGVSALCQSFRRMAL